MKVIHLHWTFNVDEVTASPLMFFALQVYVPESSGRQWRMSRATNPKLFVSVNLEPVTQYEFFFIASLQAHEDQGDQCM